MGKLMSGQVPDILNNLSPEYFKSWDDALREDEDNFDRTTKDYPYRICASLTLTDDDFDTTFIDEIDEIEEWLKNNIDTEYIAFPDAMGKYKHFWQYCFFKDEQDAVFFALRWS